MALITQGYGSALVIIQGYGTERSADFHTPADRIFLVGADSRVFTVEREDRAFLIEREDRTQTA